MKKLKFEYKFIILYVLIGGVWIKFSDILLGYIITDADLITKIQTYKGWFYVLFTAVLFFTIIKKHLLDLRKAELEAKKSDELKSAFLSNISHEIRTPMNGIIGFSELLYEGDLPLEKEREFINIVRSSSQQLLRIVNDVVDISLIESGNHKINHNQFNLNLFLNELILNFKSVVKENVDLRIENDFSDENALIVSDKTKLQQIINNLVNNAIKFTSKGSIVVSYTLINNYLQFCVRDTGAGIDSSLYSVIFQRFYKFGGINTNDNTGVGLGLAICKGHVELLGGTIWLESEMGKGTSFYFTIPYRTIPESRRVN